MFACGGTGGHIFPAIALADELKRRLPNVKIVFVGAENGMENDLVPRAGYEIVSLPISGFYRNLNVKNIFRNAALPFKFVVSFVKSLRLMRKFSPNLVVGTGGYASFPLLRASVFFSNIFRVIQEQNAFPGLSNRLLAPFADLIFLGNEAAKKYFPEKKCRYTGNPVRVFLPKDRNQLLSKWRIEKNKTILFVTGGSLGSGAINAAIYKRLDDILSCDVHLIWQTGKYYFDRYRGLLGDKKYVTLLPFVDDVSEAYTLADAVVSRAGALTLSELMHYRKPALLIPSPNVADDHQRHNAESLTRIGGAKMILESEIGEKFFPALLCLLEHRNAIIERLKTLAVKNAAKECIDAIMEEYGGKD